MKQDVKIPKSVELTSLLASHFDSGMDYNERVGITKLANSIELSNGSHPHVHTTEKEMRRWKIIQDLAPYLKFIEDKEKGTISEIWKLEPTELTFKKEIRNKIVNLENQIDILSKKIDKLIKKTK